LPYNGGIFMANAKHLEKLLKGVAVWNKWRMDQRFNINPDLSGVKLQKADLRGVDFSLEVNLKEADFQEANLQGADFSSCGIGDCFGSTLTNANFFGANLSGANFVAADFEGANFQGAILDNITFIGVDSIADVRRASLQRVNLQGTDLKEVDLNSINLEEANLSGANLSGANLNGANLSGANLKGANLQKASLCGVSLQNANISGADLQEANLCDANLQKANLKCVNLQKANLRGAIMNNVNLKGADLSNTNINEVILSGTILNRVKFVGVDFTNVNIDGVQLFNTNLEKAILKGLDLSQKDLSNVNLQEANLSGANLSGTNFEGANLCGANLSKALLIGTNFKNTTLNECKIFGISAWNLMLSDTKQSNLVITDEGEPIITVDNLEVAQFIYVLLFNEKIRDVINTITTKVVLILGRFTEERKAILDAIRKELRLYNYIPVMFDFDKPTSRNFTETVKTLAHLARFIIADITDAKSIPQELEAIVPRLKVPVQPLLNAIEKPYGMFEDFYDYKWVLDIYRYNGINDLMNNLKEKIIVPAEALAQKLEDRKRKLS